MWPTSLFWLVKNVKCLKCKRSKSFDLFRFHCTFLDFIQSNYWLLVSSTIGSVISKGIFWIFLCILQYFSELWWFTMWLGEPHKYNNIYLTIIHKYPHITKFAVHLVMTIALEVFIVSLTSPKRCVYSGHTCNAFVWR